LKNHGGVRLLVAAGILVRLYLLLVGRSLWLDEAMIGLNIGRRSFGELAGHLDFNQAAPLGFLWLEKLAVVLLGLGERSLRLWPFLAGVAALLVFARLSRRLLAPGAALFAVAMFALSTSLAYYAAEVKQYSFDVLLAAALLWLCIASDRPAPNDARDRWPRWLLLGLVGGLGVWFSHPLVFVFPGAALFLALRGRGAPERTRPLLLVAAVWMLSFAAAYLLTSRDLSRSPLMARFWADGFMPLPPTSLEDLRWFVGAFTGWIREAIDFSETVSPVRTIAIWGGGALALVGVVATWRRDRAELALVGGPILVALGASAAALYPFRGRLILFLVPSTLLLTGRGLEALGSVGARPAITARGLAGRAALFVGVALPALSAVVLAGWVAAPGREESRPVFEHVAARLEPGDVVYLHSGIQHAYLFYERTCPACALTGATVLRGGFLAGDDAAIRRDLASLPSEGRVWLLFAHEWWGYGDIERRRMTELLAPRASATETFERPGAWALLFDLGAS